jgi:hypothetical protein
MMRKFMFVVVLFSTPALAQQPQPAQQQHYMMSMTPDELQTTLNALTDVETMPWKKTNPVIATLVNQMRAQQAAVAKPAAPTTATPPTAPEE